MQRIRLPLKSYSLDELNSPQANLRRYIYKVISYKTDSIFQVTMGWFRTAYFKNKRSYFSTVFKYCLLYCNNCISNSLLLGYRTNSFHFGIIPRYRVTEHHRQTGSVRGSQWTRVRADDKKQAEGQPKIWFPVRRRALQLLSIQSDYRASQ